MKALRECIRLKEWCRKWRKTINKERRLAADPEHAAFIRAKRSAANLPDSRDTQFISQQRSWKWRSKKRAQWEPSPDQFVVNVFDCEIKIFEGEQFVFNYKGNIYATDTDPSFFVGGMRDRYLSLWSRYIGPTNIETEKVYIVV